MIHLPEVLNAWGSERFVTLLREAIEHLPHQRLPLQQGLRYSSQVSNAPFQAMILGMQENAETIRVTATLFYRGVIAGCSCADDPTPLDTQQESCALEIVIDKVTAGVHFELLQDEEDDYH